MFPIWGMAALNYRETESQPVSFSNIKPFINKYNCDRINYPPKMYDWKTTFQENNLTIVFNVLYIKEKKYVLSISQKLIQIVENKLFY